MQFEFSPELEARIREKKIYAVAVTIADTSNSDLNVEELYIRLVDRKTADFMKEKQNFHPYATDVCEVLLPNYRLDYAPVVKFYLTKFLLVFPMVKSEGISF